MNSCSGESNTRLCSEQPKTPQQLSRRRRKQPSKRAREATAVVQPCKGARRSAKDEREGGDRGAPSQSRHTTTRPRYNPRPSTDISRVLSARSFSTGPAYSRDHAGKGPARAGTEPNWDPERCARVCVVSKCYICSRAREMTSNIGRARAPFETDDVTHTSGEPLMRTGVH